MTLARGEHDPTHTDEQLARLGAPTVTLPGLGHNAHAESPEQSIASSTHTDDPVATSPIARPWP